MPNLIAPALAASLLVIALLLAYGQYQRAERLQSEFEQVAEAGRSKDRILALYRTQGRKNSERLQQLQASIHTVNDTLAARTRRLKALEAENAELKAWADTRLPAAVVQLRQRPALSGASAYRQWLSERDTLPPASSSPAQQ